jgi:hydroxyacylglutathione hydrolase
MSEIFAIPAFSDNYIWALKHNNKLAVVDPGDAAAVKEVLISQNLDLEAILITHWHPDHTGGVIELSKEKSIPVYGPKGGHIEGITIELNESDKIELFDEFYEILETPGHTLDHISYFSKQEIPVLFCGDTLFSGGCGRLFEGTPEQMFSSLNKLSLLPDNTMVFCTHEYTLSNLNFAIEVEPKNSNLLNYYNEVRKKRENDIITIPSNMKLEKDINPFLRYSEETIIKSAEKYSSKTNLTDVEVLGAIRTWKDNF